MATTKQTLIKQLQRQIDNEQRWLANRAKQKKQTTYGNKDREHVKHLSELLTMLFIILANKDDETIKDTHKDKEQKHIKAIKLSTRDKLKQTK